VVVVVELFTVDVVIGVIEDVVVANVVVGILFPEEKEELVFQFDNA
jgi:hypothetical protein